MHLDNKSKTDRANGQLSSINLNFNSTSHENSYNKQNVVYKGMIFIFDCTKSESIITVANQDTSTLR